MGTVNINLGEDTQLNLVLGQQLENEVTEVVFDFSAWQFAYGSGIVGLSVQRHGDDRPYAVVPTVSGTVATWNISDLDTARKGVGEVQVTYTVGTVIKKSVVYKFTVYRSLGENGEYPSPGQTWQEEIEAELTDVKADLGDLSELETEDKSSLVNAINEAAQSGGGGTGGITVVDTVAEMVDTESVYLYNGTQTGYTAGHWYFYNIATSAWTDGGEYTGWETVETALERFLQENAQQIGTLTIVIGNTTYSFNGSANVSISLPVYNGGVS